MTDIAQLEPGTPIGSISHLSIGAGSGAGTDRALIVRNGTISETREGAVVHGDGTSEARAGEVAADIDGNGWLAVPTLVDAHAHLDKSHSGELAPTAAGGSLDEAVASWRAIGQQITVDSILERGRRHVMAALGCGVTAIRTHADYHAGEDPLRGIRALVALREEFRGLVDIQVVALQSHDRPLELLREAARLGPDLVGACPHLTPDPMAELERAARLAEEFGLGLDLHTDETLDPGSRDIVDLAARTRAWPASMIRTASHCVSLASQPSERLDEMLSAVAGSGVSIVSNPITNLSLQGRDGNRPTPRAIPPLRSILAAGITLAAGGDNVQDPFNPLGRGDMWEVVALLVTAGHLTPSEAYEIASAGGRSVMGLPRAGLEPGHPADFILVRAASLTEAIAEGAPDRVVVRGGIVVSASIRRTRQVTRPQPGDAA